MCEQKHSPGPYTISDMWGDNACVVGGSGEVIADCGVMLVNNHENAERVKLALECHDLLLQALDNLLIACEQPGLSYQFSQARKAAVEAREEVADIIDKATDKEANKEAKEK